MNVRSYGGGSRGNWIQVDPWTGRGTPGQSDPGECRHFLCS